MSCVHRHTCMQRTITEDAAITKTLLMVLLIQTLVLMVVSLPADASVYPEKGAVIHAMTFEIIYFFCLAEQNIWLYFLAYRHIINNSHLNPPSDTPLSIPFSFF